MKISVIIPVYNEEKNIEKCADRLDSYLKNNFESYEIIFLNDGSTDSTLSVAQKIEKSTLSVKVISYDNNMGKGCAVRCGMIASSGDIAIFTDCDLAYGTDVIKNAVELFDKSQADIVIGSRNIMSDSYSEYTFMRKFMSKLYFKIIALASGFSHSDSQCGFKCFTKKCAHDIFSECTINGFAFDLEALIKADKKGYKIAELPVKILNHDKSESKVRPVRDTLKMLSDIRKIKRNEKIKKD